MKVSFTPEKLQNPFIIEWTLSRLEDVSNVNPQEAKFLEDLFDDISIKKLIKENDPMILPGLFRVLPPEKFVNHIPELCKRWFDCKDDAAYCSINVISIAAPKEFVELTKKFLSKMDKYYDEDKIIEIIEGLCRLEPPLGINQAEDIIRRLYINRENDSPEMYNLDIFELAHHYKLDVTCKALTDIIYQSSGNNDEPWFNLDGVYSILTGNLPYMDHILGLREKKTKQKFRELSVFFKDNTPLRNFDKLVHKSGKDIIKKIPALMPADSESQWSSLECVRLILSQMESGIDREQLNDIGIFALGLLIASYSKELYDFQNYSLSELIKIASSDIIFLPCYDQIAESIKTFSRDEIVSMLKKAIKKAHNTWGEVHLAQIMGDIGYKEFVDVLIDCTSQKCDEQVCDTAEESLIKIGSVSETVIINRWERLDFRQKMYCAHVLELIGGDKTVYHLLNWDFSSEQSLEEIWCSTALGVPDARYIDILSPELKREQSYIDDTFYKLCVLFDHDHPELSNICERLSDSKELVMNRINALMSDDVEELFDETIKLQLVCDSCGKENTYDVETIFIDPRHPQRKPFIADELICKSCGEQSSFSLAKGAHFTIAAELIKVRMANEKDIEYEGPLNLVTLTIYGKKQVGPAEAITHYQKMLDKEPNNVGNLLGMGNILKHLTRTEKAMDYFRKCLSLDPYCAEAAFNMSNILYDEGECEEAINILQEALNNQDKWHYYKLHSSSPEEFKQLFLETYDDYINTYDIFSNSDNDFNNKEDISSYPEFQLPLVRKTEKVSRNSPCPCGSGKKYKHCCLGKKN